MVTVTGGHTLDRHEGSAPCAARRQAGLDRSDRRWRWRRMAVEKTMASSSLAEVVDRILDKGVVVDAWARVSLVGIEILAIEARVTVAGVDTFLKYAEAVGLTAAAAA